MYSRLHFWLVMCLFSASTAFAGCGTVEETPTSTPTPLSVLQTVEVPVTVESTRLVEQTVVVTATPTEPTPCHPENLADASQLVIGALVPITGRSSVGGLTMQAGINLAVEKINNEGGVQGKPIQLVTYDTNSNQEIGKSRAVQLITQDCVIGIVGIYDSDVALGVKDILNQYNIPGIFVDTYNDQITASLYPEVFRIAPSMTMFAQLAANWLSALGDYNGDGELFAVIVSEDAPYGKMQTEQTVHWLDEAAIAHNELYVDLPTTDFSSVIARIVDMDTTPDVIFIRIPGESSLILQKQLQENGIGPLKMTLIETGQSALNDAKFWQTMEAEGVFTVALRIGPWANTVPEEGKLFAAQYQQYYTQWPTNAAFGGYDSVRLLADAAQRSATLQGSDMVVALEETRITLAAGTYTFPINQSNPPSESFPAYLWHQWQDVPLLYLQYTEQNQPASETAVIWPEVYRTVEGPIVLPNR